MSSLSASVAPTCLPLVQPPGAADVASFDRQGYAAFHASRIHGGNVALWLASADEALQRYIDAANSHQPGLGIGKENGFRELVMKDPSRYDVNFDNAEGNDAIVAAFIRDIRRHMLQVAGPLLSRVLGPDYRLNAQGMVTSELGAPAQGWHVDSSHLFTGPVEQYSHLPCHFVTIFMPLFRSSLPIGPTELSPGSHKLTSVLKNEVIPDQYPEGAVLEELLDKAQASLGSPHRTVYLDFSPGDVIVTDGRLLHRGLRNTLQRRHLLYVSFCRPFYYEWPRSQSDHRSLFTGNVAKL